MKKYLTIISLITIHFFYSQEYNNRLYSFIIEDIKYFKYEDINIYASINDIKDVKNETPEQLAESIISCTNKEWEILNSLEGEKDTDLRTSEEYEQVKKMDKTKNYLILVNKIEFSIEKIPTVVLKFYYITKSFPKPQAGIFVMQQYNNKWFKTNTKMINNIALSILRIKPELLDKILNSNFDTEELKKIKSQIIINNNLDFNALSNEIDSWYEKNPKMLKYFKDENSIL